MLKIDLHTHTNFVHKRFDSKLSPKELINLAAKLKYDVLAITEHASVRKLFRIKYYPNALKVYNRFKDYAKRKNILLIPGVETYVDGKEVLLINFRDKIKPLTFSDLEDFKRENVLVIAPHPFYSRRFCLGKDLEKHIDLFDAIEHSHFYLNFLNKNKKAIELAKKYKKPLIANSDAHLPFHLGINYTLADAKKNMDSVLEAIRKNRIRIVTRPLNTKEFAMDLYRCMIALLTKELV